MHLRTPLDLLPDVFNACEQSCIIVIMRGSSMHNAEHDIKAAMYPAYGTHHRLRSISEK